MQLLHRAVIARDMIFILLLSQEIGALILVVYNQVTFIVRDMLTDMSGVFKDYVCMRIELNKE